MRDPFDVHQPHDAIFRSTFSRVEHAAPVLRAIVSPHLASLIDWSSLRLLPGSFIDEALRKSQSDLLFEARLSGRPVLLYLLFEHQSQPDRLMPLRLLGYMCNVWREHARAHGTPLPFIVPIVLHHGENGWIGATRLSALFDADEAERITLDVHVPDFEMLVHELGLVPSEHLRGQTSITALGRVVLVLLARARASKNFMGELRALIPLLRAVLESATGRDDFVSLIYYMLSVANVRADEIVELVRERLTEPAAEDAMTAAQELIKEGRIMGWREGRAEGQALGRAEGEALGRAEGEALGRAEGEALGRAEMLSKLLRRRFGELTEAHESLLRAASIETLDAMAETILTAQSVEEVLASR